MILHLKMCLRPLPVIFWQHMYIYYFLSITMETRAIDVTTPTVLRHHVGAVHFRDPPRSFRWPHLAVRLSAIDFSRACNGPVPFATKLDRPASSGAHSFRTAVCRLPLRSKVSDLMSTTLKAPVLFLICYWDDKMKPCARM